MLYILKQRRKKMYFEKLWNSFSELNEVEAIALGGSRAGKNFDQKSDYDLYTYCTKLPSENLRKSILENCCSYMEISNSFWELEDDCTLKNGIDIDILYRNLENFSNDVASVVEQHYAHNGYTTCMWHNLLNSKILYDKDGRFASIQKRFSITYPIELKQNIINQNMRLLTGNLPSYDLQIKKALSRGDYISVNHRTAAFLESYFDIIFAINELTHPGEKRMLTYAKEHAKILPKKFEENINSLLENLFEDSAKAMQILENMITEVKIICKQ